MAQKSYLPKQETKLGDFLSNYGQKIPVHGPTCGLTPAEIADAQLWCAIGLATIGLQDSVAMYAQGITRFKKSVLWATEPVAAWPNPFALPAGLPASVIAGVVPLLTLQIGRLKRHAGYTKQIGEELGTEGPDVPLLAAADAAALKPVLKLRLDTGGHPLVLWKKQGLTGLELLVDRGDGKGFVFLALDTIPDYLDTFALPAAGTSAVWIYKGIYHQGDEQVGQWSDPVKISVMGQ
ncbi:MAG: hypothetical protein PCFJNLEI_03990 [Verrucomicrobiae bacterium]|nr:hypothetical protein [Verrucomicrobiae bacterium]